MLSDEEFGALFRKRFLGPKLAQTTALYDRARERGEIDADADVEVIGPALAGILLHRLYVLGKPVDDAMVARVVDHVILPAVRPRADAD